MSNLKKRYCSLVDRLHAKTVAGELAWEIDLASNLWCEFGEYKVFLDSYRDADGEPIETIEIKDQFNALIDSFSDATLSGMLTEQGSEFLTYYSKMNDLREQARRLAMGADDALASILKDLGED